MSARRTWILEWLEQGRLQPRAVPEALRLAGVSPKPSDWRLFLDRLALWLGASFLAFSVIFFFAYNWDALGRYFKFGLVEALLVASVAAAWRLGLERASGKAALFVATLLVGALLALVGQTYQTGADTFELFAAWALLALPLVAVSRLPALWLVWIGLLNLAVTFYYQVFGGVFGLLFGTEKLLWMLFALDTACLVAWELLSRSGVGWLRERWATRLLATASGALVTWLAVWAIFEMGKVGAAGPFGHMAWLVAAYACYRHRMRDLYVLAGGVLSAIVVVAAFLSKSMVSRGDAGAFLFIGMVVIGLSAAGGYWLKQVAAEDEA